MSPCASQNNPEEASGWIVWVHLLVSSSLNIVVMCPTTCSQFACLDCSTCFMVICKCTIIDAKTSKELVFGDASSPFEDIIIHFFVMSTSSAAGGLPLGIVVTSAESTDVIYQRVGRLSM